MSSLENDPTAVEKTLPPLFKSVEQYLWKGMKPFPALTPLLEGMMHVNFISFQRTYPYMDCTYSFAFSAPLRETFFSRDIFSRQAAKGAKACNRFGKTPSTI